MILPAVSTTCFQINSNVIGIDASGAELSQSLQVDQKEPIHIHPLHTQNQKIIQENARAVLKNERMKLN